MSKEDEDFPECVSTNAEYVDMVLNRDCLFQTPEVRAYLHKCCPGWETKHDAEYSSRDDLIQIPRNSLRFCHHFVKLAATEEFINEGVGIVRIPHDVVDHVEIGVTEYVERVLYNQGAVNMLRAKNAVALDTIRSAIIHLKKGDAAKALEILEATTG